MIWYSQSARYDCNPDGTVLKTEFSDENCTIIDGEPKLFNESGMPGFVNNFECNIDSGS